MRKLNDYLISTTLSIFTKKIKQITGQHRQSLLKNGNGKIITDKNKLKPSDFIRGTKKSTRNS